MTSEDIDDDAEAEEASATKSKEKKKNKKSKPKKSNSIKKKVLVFAKSSSPAQDTAKTKDPAFPSNSFEAPVDAITAASKLYTLALRFSEAQNNTRPSAARRSARLQADLITQLHTSRQAYLSGVAAAELSIRQLNQSIKNAHARFARLYDELEGLKEDSTFYEQGLQNARS